MKAIWAWISGVSAGRAPVVETHGQRFVLVFALAPICDWDFEGRLPLYVSEDGLEDEPDPTHS